MEKALPLWQPQEMATETKTIPVPERPRRKKTRLRERREAAGMTLFDLAEKTGFHPSTVHKLETGKLRIKDDQFARLANALGCRIADIVEEPRGAPAGNEIERAGEILSNLSAVQRALWFQVGDSLIQSNSSGKAVDK